MGQATLWWSKKNKNITQLFQERGEETFCNVKVGDILAVSKANMDMMAAAPLQSLFREPAVHILHSRGSVEAEVM